MKYNGIPQFMWALYKRSFSRALMDVLGYSRSSARSVMTSAGSKYQGIIEKLPEFEKEW